MGQLQITQVRGRLEQTTMPFIDVSDLEGQRADFIENAKVTRALAAFVLTQIAGIGNEEAARDVTDGTGDNGIDAIAIAEGEQRRLIIVQSKWSENGKNGASVDEMLKFKKGVNDLVSAKWDRFNERIRSRQAVFEDALMDTDLKIDIVFATMGVPELADDVAAVFNDYLSDDLNDSSDTASFTYLRQIDVHRLLIDKSIAPKINLDVEISDWGSIEGPPSAVYGHVSGAVVAEWFEQYGVDLMARNVRVVLPDSEVNDAVFDTISNDPRNFWYFNNGVTILCDRIRKAPIGGAERRQGSFSFDGVSVVNGAQTVGTLGRAYHDKEAQLSLIRVMVRFISLEDVGGDFGHRVTRATNTQNAIGARDFVGQDPEQKRIRDEFSIAELEYVIRSGEKVKSLKKGCDFPEAAIALACIHSPNLATQAKREVSRLWDDTSRSPYKALFNAETDYMRIWRAVLLVREVEAKLVDIRSTLDARSKSYSIHGNRLLSHIVYKYVCSSKLSRLSVEWDAVLGEARDAVRECLEAMITVAEDKYSGYIASMFKNGSKTDDITSMALSLLRKN